MASFSLLALLDDISLMTKVAAKKTVAVLGDDLALNAQQVAGLAAARELPVVFAVAKGSLLNKAVIIPIVLLISVVYPPLITVLLMIGGAYLAFEGAEKVCHYIAHAGKEAAAKSAEIEKELDKDQLLGPPTRDALLAFEKKKIRGAIRTDFILSAEVIVIALGSIPEHHPFWMNALVVIVVGLLMTAFVYGLVAAIVKLDDVGAHLIRKSNKKGPLNTLGLGLIKAAPIIMRVLTLAGTFAMFTVGGGILLHNLPIYKAVTATLSKWPVPWLTELLATALTGLITGAIILGVVSLLKRFIAKRSENKESAGQQS